MSSTPPRSLRLGRDELQALDEIASSAAAVCEVSVMGGTQQCANHLIEAKPLRVV
jgi:hypothetical protein